MTELEQWMKAGGYLPPNLRDFHDQKDIFKTVHDVINVEGHEYAKDVSWIVGQCYVIDIFLWFMARRGYTLQRSRAKFEFRSLEDDVANSRKRFAQSTAAIIKQAIPTTAAGDDGHG